jgi:predicted DNA-binding antitoxin AbrB/MazE fold protein
MIVTVEAVFENGVFRPLKPTFYPPGQKLELTITPIPPEKDPVLEQIRTAKSLDEVYAILDAAPPDPNELGGDDYDIEAALQANRRWSAGVPESPERRAP